MPRRRLPALLALVVPVLAACGGGADDGGGTATGRFGAVHTEVCRAAEQVRQGDRAAAEDTFDDVHFGLHALAAAADEEDRGVAARLLEAMQRVEAGLDEATLEDLVAPVRDAVVATGGTAPDDCP